MPIQQREDYLSIVLGFRISSYQQALYTYNSLYIGCPSKLCLTRADTLTQTLQNASQNIREHYAQMCERKLARWIKGYELHLSILGENVLFFNTQGEELDDDINELPYRNFSFETLCRGTNSLYKPNLPQNAKRKYIPSNEDYRKWRKSGVQMGIISLYKAKNSSKENTKADKALRTLLKTNDRICYILINGCLNGEAETSYLIYALDNTFNVCEFLYTLGVQFKQKIVLYSADGNDFERIYISKLNLNEMPYKASIWLTNGEFNVRDYECLREFFEGKYKVLQYADAYAAVKAISLN